LRVGNPAKDSDGSAIGKQCGVDGGSDAKSTAKAFWIPLDKSDSHAEDIETDDKND
jgi:hypothetical protein